MKSLRKYCLLVSVVALALVIVFGQFSAVVSACCLCTREMVVTSGTSDRVATFDTRGLMWFKPAVETWVHPLWPTIDGAAWISSSYYIEEPDGDSWRIFFREFSVPGVVVVSASINITADNAYILYVNGELVGSDGTVFGPAPDPQPWSWQSIEEYDITSIVTPGSNEMTVVVRNWEGNPTYQDNPTGLIYRIHITYQVPC